MLFSRHFPIPHFIPPTHSLISRPLSLRR